MNTIEESKDVTSAMLTASIEKLEKLNQSYVQLQSIVTAMNNTTQSQQKEHEKSKREESDMLSAKMEELKISYNQIQSMITEMKNTAQLQQRESGIVYCLLIPEYLIYYSRVILPLRSSRYICKQNAYS